MSARQNPRPEPGDAARPDADRLAAAGVMIARLDAVFARHADRLDSVEVEGLDVELTLLADAIRAEEPAPARVGTGPSEVGSSKVDPWR